MNKSSHSIKAWIFWLFETVLVWRASSNIRILSFLNFFLLDLNSVCISLLKFVFEFRFFRFQLLIFFQLQILDNLEHFLCVIFGSLNGLLLDLLFFLVWQTYFFKLFKQFWLFFFFKFISGLWSFLQKIRDFSNFFKFLINSLLPELVSWKQLVFNFFTELWEMLLLNYLFFSLSS